MRLQLWPYSMAISVAALAILLTLPLWSLIPPKIYPLFLTAVIFSAWIDGVGLGLLAIILSTLSIAYFFILPVEELHPSRGRVEGRLERISRQPHIEVSDTGFLFYVFARFPQQNSTTTRTLK